MITISTLPSGIRLVTEQMEGVRSACLGFWVGTGSRDESIAEAGISHFLEHLLFKGTADRSARSIAEDVDAVGGDMNAFTTKEYTAFYVRVLGEDLPLGLEVLSDIVIEPALRSEEVDAERTVILEEVLMHRDEPSDVVQERFAEAIFPDHPLGREVLGLPEVIESVTPDAIRAFLERHYRPANLVVAAAGDVDHDLLGEEIERRFAGAPLGERPKRAAPGDTVRALDVVERDSEQAHLVLGMRAPARRDEQRFAFTLFNHVLGGGLSSRLFQKIREERGLAYSIGSDRVSYDDAGALVISVGTAPERAFEVLDLIDSELALMLKDGVTDRELALAKGHVRADTTLSLEDSGSRMARIGASLLLHDEVLSADDFVTRVEAVTRDEVNALAEQLLHSERVLAAVGPFSEAEFAGRGAS